MHQRVTGQDTTHVVFFNHGDLAVDDLDGLNRQPFNDQNPDGPLELCTCATYHAFYDPATGVPEPSDGRPVYAGLRPDFVWPESA